MEEERERERRMGYMDRMMHSALLVWERVGRPDMSGSSPSGPDGCSGGGKWFTYKDVLICAYKSIDKKRLEGEWDRGRDVTVPLASKRYDLQEGVEIWPHQEDAISRCVSPLGVFKSGILDMDCGSGKSMIGVELVRRSRSPCVVVTQHVLSLNQWVVHFEQIAGMKEVLVFEGGKRKWSPLRGTLPDVTIMTYSALSRSLACMDEENASEEFLFPWAARVLKFGLLILDEVHLAAADHFKLACTLRSSARIGLTGSYVREDEKLRLLSTSVGDVLYEHRSGGKLDYSLYKVGLHSEVGLLLSRLKRRVRSEHCVRTLNPSKIAAFLAVLKLPSFDSNRFVVFCDSAEAIHHLSSCVTPSCGREWVGNIHGGSSGEERERVVASLLKSRRGVVFTTRVCAAGVDFPKDCVVVILHSSSGSRQQEVQRCGRGTRGEVKNARVVHIVNVGTEEERFVEKRVDHIRLLYGDALTVTRVNFSHKDASSSEMAPLLSYLSSTRGGDASPKRRRGKLRSQIRKARRLFPVVSLPT